MNAGLYVSSEADMFTYVTFDAIHIDKAINIIDVFNVMHECLEYIFFND